ncbi:thioredoxin-like domain-containing protein [Flavobacterium sp.]|jgi:thiol-disulfide isomerase/thioredoxin|uniref:thioredoxin-like domain-containing protein n=1 Tax=Flavobacterium sp. TaxID=239 RepID=UPI0037C14BED
MIFKKLNIFFSVIFILIVSSCSDNEKTIIIEGNIPNLPDGTIYLSRMSYNDKIDSVITKNGKFKFSYKIKSDEPIYLGLHHIDKKGVFMMTGFPTNAKYNDGGFTSSLFMSDSVIVINGKFKEFHPVGIPKDIKTRFVDFPRIKAGYQTNALFHIDGDLFDNITKESFNKILFKIKEYPNSFHLLYSVNEYKNSFSPIQIDNFLRTFKGEITKSKTFNKLKNYNDKRKINKDSKSPLLKNQKGKIEKVLDSRFDKHLVVFWASWCGPCRQEIPGLKNIYKKFKNKVEFVSISTDSNEQLWLNALEKEKMPWKQFIVNEKSNEYEKIEIFFQLSKSIPYTLLLDKNMKVIKSHVGLMSEIELDKYISE